MPVNKNRGHLKFNEMKKIIAVLSVCCVIMACSNNSENKTQTTTGQDTDVSGTGTAAPAGSAKGEELIATNDCLTCHKVDTKLIGPSYQEVAAKYTATDANINMLAGKIIEGGSGNWGEIPMTPHPAVSTDDAKEMVRYILAL